MLCLPRLSLWLPCLALLISTACGSTDEDAVESSGGKGSGGRYSSENTGGEVSAATGGAITGFGGAGTGVTITGGSPGAGTGGASGGSPGAGTGGDNGSGGTSSGGTGGTPAETSTDPNLLVAFIGDQGNGSAADAVLSLIKAEGALATVHNGDFDYGSNPNNFENRINDILGENYPYFAVVGNHDAPAWAGSGGYGEKIANRVARVSDMVCSGEPGIEASCTFRGLHLVQTCVGTTEFKSGDSRKTTCAANSPEQISFIRDTLKDDGHVWSICSWHKNQRDMQVGGKGNEVGWSAYQECMAGKAIVSTGHEHSYSRTMTLTDLGFTGHGATGAHDLVHVDFGRTFVFVSGLGGNGVRTFNSGYHDSDTWWSSYYTSDRWMKNGVTQTGTGEHGALFITFNVDGNPNLARAYFKDVKGRIVDAFDIKAQ